MPALPADERAVPAPLDMNPSMTVCRAPMSTAARVAHASPECHAPTSRHRARDACVESVPLVTMVMAFNAWTLTNVYSQPATAGVMREPLAQIFPEDASVVHVQMASEEPARLHAHPSHRALITMADAMSLQFAPTRPMDPLVVHALQASAAMGRLDVLILMVAQTIHAFRAAYARTWPHQNSAIHVGHVQRVMLGMET